jgi:protein ImuB
MPTRALSLWCPDWPVAAARRRDPALVGAPIAVLEGGFVLAASAEARAEGVRRGLRRREAEARCPGIVILAADPVGEGRAFEAVARAIETLAPRLALDRPGILFVPTRGPSRYFGGDTALGARVAAEASAVGVPDARVGVADGTFAARLAARRAAPGRAFVVPPGGSAAFLAPWPVRVLEDAPLSSLLVRLGLATLGDFAGLPPASVLGRFGEAGLAAHCRARGEEEHPPAVRVPPPERVETHEFDPPADRVDVAVFAGRALAERLATALAGDGLACTRVRVEAETEHGERLARCWRLEAGLGSGVLAERVRWQLEAWVTATAEEEATSGLTLLRLVPDEVVVAGRSQFGLWGGDRAAAERAARALVRIQALLGPEAVTMPVRRGGRTPDEQMAWVPWGEEAGDGHSGHGNGGRGPTSVPNSGAPWPGAVPPPAPAVVFRPPRPAELLDAGGRPVTVSARGEASAPPDRLSSPVLPGGGGPVEAWAGPWLHDLRWWDASARRRRALWQVVVRAPNPSQAERNRGCGAAKDEVRGGVACLVAVEGGQAHLEAVYD